MPRLTAETSIEAKKASTAPIIFIRVLNIPHRDGSGSTSVYLCDAGEFVSFFDENGDPEAYIPVGIEFDRIEQDNTTRMVNFRVRIDNVSRDFCTLANQGIIDGCRIEILRGYRALLSDVSYAQPLIQGIIQSWRITEATIELEVTSAIGLFQKVPRRLCWSRCQWQFKGDICRANERANEAAFAMRAWKRTSANYTTIDDTVPPDVNQLVSKIDFSNFVVAGATTYWNMRIEGRIVPKFTEPLTLKVTSDDGVRLWVDGVLKIDRWITQAPTAYTTTVSATKGVPLAIRIDHYQVGGSETLRLQWSSASLPEEIVGNSPGSVGSVGSVLLQAATTCGKTLEDCKRFYNVRRFGGFPYIEKSRDPRQIWTRV